MKQQEAPIVAWIGLDWSDQEHYICLQAEGCEGVQSRVLKHEPEAIQQWVQQLRRLFPQGRVALALEQSRGPLIYALMHYEFLLLYPVPPKTLAKYREAFCSSGAKDDPSDVALLLEILRYHRSRLRPWKPDDERTRLLQRLVEYRGKTVDQRTALSNELTSLLKEYFPQVLHWAGSLKKRRALDFLSRWPTLQVLQQTPPEQIREFYRTHRCRGQAVLKERLQEIRQALPLTQDRAVLEASQIRVRILVQQPCAWPWKSWRRKSPSVSSNIPIGVCTKVYPGLERPWRPGCWWPSVPIAAVIPRPRSFNSSPALLRSPGAAADPAGFTGVWPVPSSCVRASTNLPPIPLPARFGRGPTTNCNVSEGKDIMLPSVPWPTNGFAFFFAAGNPGNPMMRTPTCAPSNAANHRFGLALFSNLPWTWSLE